MTSPWLEPDIAAKQRTLVDEQLAWWIPRNEGYDQDSETRNFPHFNALVDAVKATQCPGSILEVGCGVGHGREVLDRAGVEYASYAGVDISPTALALAKERYPESEWYLPEDLPVRDMVSVEEKTATKDVMTFTVRTRGAWNIVIDGSCLLHVEDWKKQIAMLCKMSRRWIVLHRVPATTNATHRTKTSGYGHEFPAWRFNDPELVAEMKSHGFESVAATLADGDSMTLTFARPRHWVSYCDKAYLPRLKALHASMVRHCRPFVLHCLSWSNEVAAWCATAGVPCEAIEAFLERHPDLKLEALSWAPSRRDHKGVLPSRPRTRLEHMETCGPMWLADVIEITGEAACYVDSDIAFFSSPEPVFAEIGGAQAAVFPHNFADAKDGLPGPTLETHHVFGIQNCGLVYVAEKAVALDWGDKVRDWCFNYVDAPLGMQEDLPYADRRFRFGDQGYLSDWPKQFDACVVKHPGAALGPWAINTRALDVRDGVVHFGGVPLVTYHFSGMQDLPDGHSVATRPEYCLTKRAESIVYTAYYQCLMDNMR